MLKPLNILLISSRPPQHSAGLAKDYIHALELFGHHVDFLTKYNYSGKGSNEYYVLREKLWMKVARWGGKHKKLYNFFHRFHLGTYFMKSEGYKARNKSKELFITNLYENIPPVAPSLIVERIHKQYDLVITLFWQDFLTTVSLKAIYDKLGCPIIICSVDMFPYTGGCFFFGDCQNFMHECGQCPALNSNDKNDQTHQNFLIKKEMYANMNYAICLNSWMQQFAKCTGLFKPERIITSSLYIDESVFRPMDSSECKEWFGIDSNSFVLFARSPSKSAIIAKGFGYLIRSVNHFADTLDEEQRDKIVLILAGRELSDEEKGDFHIKVKNLGTLNRDDLIKAYNASHIFLSPSIDDAGPSMVNQSIMCGTPVVCFNIGTAWDVIKNGKSGYKVPLKDEEAFGKAISQIFNMTDEYYCLLSSNTRKIAIEYNSLKAFSKIVEDTYLFLKNKK